MASATLLAHKTLARPFLATATARLSQPFLRRPTVTRMSYNPTPATDRIISAVAYTLPFLNSIHYGKFLLKQSPKLGAAMEPIMPLVVEPILPMVRAYQSNPYLAWVGLLALYLGVVRNKRFSYFARFNAMQAVSLDMLLLLPLILHRIFGPALLARGYNAIFVVSLLCFVYGCVFSLLGLTPYLPFVSDAASQQL